MLLFLFWDLTAIASYLLIGFDRQHREARLSALMALLVTGVSARAAADRAPGPAGRVRHHLDPRAARTGPAGGDRP